MSSLFVRGEMIARINEIITDEAWLCNYVDIENLRAEPGQQDWITIEFLGADETQITTGAPGENTFRETGTFLVHYVTTSGTGSQTTLERLEFIRTTLRATTVNDITIDAVSPPDTMEGSSLSGVRGNWWGASIAINNYEYDIRG